MTKQYVDRGQVIAGEERTVRDVRNPPQLLRKMENFSIPDGRAKRRPGFKVHNTDPQQYQMLAKATGTGFFGRSEDAVNFKNNTLRTPLSYAVLRWHTDYQLAVAQDKTIEFLLKLGDKEALVQNPFQRRAKITQVGGAGVTYDLDFRQPGVFVLDQTILSNYHTFDTGTIAVPATEVALNRAILVDTDGTNANPIFDVFPLTTLSILYTEASIFVEAGVVNTASGKYWPNEILLQHDFSGASYTVGDLIHVAVTYDSATRVLTFYIDGAVANNNSAYTVPAGYQFIGETDNINGLAATAVPRDIVLLNECTARAGYSSSCSMWQDTNTPAIPVHQTFFHAYDDDPNDINSPWCCSPPRGTAMSDLRIWDTDKSAGELLTLAYTRIRESTGTVTNLVDNWPLNDGVGVCKNINSSSTDGTRKITVHHGYPTYVDDDDLLHKLGLSLADGQHIIKRFEIDEDSRHISDGYSSLRDTFTEDGTNDHEESNDFTVQIQIRAPYSFQHELNETTDKGNTLQDVDAGEARETMADGAQLVQYQLEDGMNDPANSGINGNLISGEYPRAFDMTLWSIEGTKKESTVGTPPDISISSNAYERFRVPVARAVINPSGKVAFEVYKQVTGTGAPTLIRLLSSSALTAGTVYTLTFVQRTTYAFSAGTVTPDGYKLEIWIQASGGSASLDNSHTETSDMSRSYEHRRAYDIIVGASQVHMGWDKSIHPPLVTSDTSPFDHGPWRVAQLFMSAYQDQPGFFTLGFFRLWTTSIDTSEVEETGFSSISSEDYTAALLCNIEIENISGTSLPNVSRYDMLFDLGYKSWGVPQGYRNDSTTNQPHLRLEMHPSGYTHEDGLGYLTDNGSTLADDVMSSDIEWPKCTGLASYSSTIAQEFGLLAMFDESLSLDAAVDGTLVPVHVHSRGLMNDFIRQTDWRGTSIGDRTFLTSRGGLTKVYDGKNVTLAGFGAWCGGVPAAVPTTSGSGALTVDKYYGLRYAYFSESRTIQQVSPLIAAKTLGSNGGIDLVNIPAHPDPRVTGIVFYRTLAQETEALARSAPLFLLTRESNVFIPRFAYIDADTALVNSVLDLNITPFPVCEFSASMAGSLYLFGDLLVPDAVYFTDPGNPERIDAIANQLILEEGSGDRIIGGLVMFGSLFIFKPNSIWRISVTGVNQHQVDRMAEIGPVSPNAYLVFTEPTQGRTMIFLWTEHGPYLFDGNRVQYVGSPIEEVDDPSAFSSTYDWLDPTTVVLIHDFKRREIICLHKPKEFAGSDTTRTTFDRNAHGAVFNYKEGAWYRYTGLQGRLALAQNFSTSSRSGTATLSPAPATLTFDSSFKSLIAGEFGRIFRWGEDKYDGFHIVTWTNPATVTAWNAGTYQLTFSGATLPAGFEVAGVWATVRKTSDNTFRSAPIVRKISTTVVLLDSGHVDDFWSGFTPTASGYEIYIGWHPAVLEFPWDFLEAPFFDKEIIELVTWHDTEIFYKLSRDYDGALPATNAYVALADGNNKRKRTQIKSTVEAAKLELLSWKEFAEIDSLGYNVHHKRGHSTPRD